MTFAKPLVLSAFALLSATALHAQSVTVMNSFNDPNMTGGKEIAFMQTSGQVDAPIELRMYTITAKDGQVKFELIDNSGATDLVFPEGRQDIWYIAVEGATSYSLSEDSDANFMSTSTNLDTGYTAMFDGKFRDELATEVPLEGGGIRVVLNAGTNLETVGTSWVVNYE